MAVRTLIQDFQLGNPLYIGATVTFYTVSGGAKTSTKATIYSALTGTATLANPQTLDSDGKLQQAVYADVATVATVSGLTVADHDTGVMQPIEEGAVFLIENMAIEHANAATVARIAAELAETNAETAETNAETAETNAETAESNANEAAGRAEVDAALAMGNAAQATASNVVRGPAAATDSAIALFDGTGGTTIKDSTYTITAAGAALLDDATAAAQATTLGLGTGDSPEFAAVNIGHATDTTLTRVSAGVLAVEGSTVAMLDEDQPWTGLQSCAFETLTDAAPVAWDMSGGRNNRRLTLGGNRTIDLSNVVEGASGLLDIRQDSVGGRTLTFGSAFDTAISITLATAASAANLLAWAARTTASVWVSKSK